MNAPIRVLVVDDSAVVRQVVSEILSAAPGIEVVGTASDPLFAMAKMRRDWPDVITLDVEMPRMDGISFLRQLMAERPTPVIVCSTLTSRGAETTMQALAAGADWILLDNMSVEMLRDAVARCHQKATTEASGGVTLDSVRRIAETGVDRISVGALTHSAPALDLALDFEGM